MRSGPALILLVAITGCSTTSSVERASSSVTASPFPGRWVPSAATTQPYLASTMGFQLALDPNGTTVTRCVLVNQSTTRPATVVREIKERGTWLQTSPTTAELCLDGSCDRATAKLVSDDQIVISAPKTPNIELQRER